MSDPRQQAVQRLAEAGVDNPRLDARVLWDAAGGDPARYESFITRRLSREPVAYITGHREFWSLDFEVGPGVLIPRPDTETIIEQALVELPDRSAPLNILDFGTGSGCILAALLTEFPKARGLGVDFSDVARKFANSNLTRLGLSGRAEILAGNWGENLLGGWDVIVSNPPYIRTQDIAGLEPEVRDFEPISALDGGIDGLDAVRALGPVLKRLLTGVALIEVGAGQAEEAAAQFSDCGLRVARVAADLSGILRVVIVHQR